MKYFVNTLEGQRERGEEMREGREREGGRGGGRMCVCERERESL
jgi:hypothetical protein